VYLLRTIIFINKLPYIQQKVKYIFINNIKLLRINNIYAQHLKCTYKFIYYFYLSKCTLFDNVLQLLSMFILKSVYDEIVKNSPFVPPEIGGILGGQKGLVTDFFVDVGLPSNGYDEFIPNTELFNRIIDEWRHRNISLIGLFHTHFSDGEKLSISDIRYINKIMETIPIEKLYFPIVIPKKKIIVYFAKKLNGKTIITREDLRIICDGG